MADGTPALSREQVEAAIAAQEGLRATLGDEIVDATIAALRAKLPSWDEVTHQRKLATLLFTDVVGSTDLMRGHDPEETMAVMDSALARLAQPVQAHGGRVTRFMGDGFMAVFGLPTAQENDPEMAVRSGLAIVAEAARLAVDLEREHGLAGFDVRVGINTGLVVTGGVTEAADTIMGDAVNLAARLESAAPPGGVLISRDTHQHVRGRFEMADHGEVEAKGFAKPVGTYLVTGYTDVETRPTTRGIEGVDIPMVGRDQELADLRATLGSVESSGILRSVSIVADAGLGKTRLIDDFRAGLDPEGIHVLPARGMLETRDLPYALVRNLVELRFDIRPGDGAAATRDRLVAGVIADLAALDEGSAAVRAAFIGQLIGYDFTHDPAVRALLDSPQQLRSRAVLHLTEWLAAVTDDHPVVLALDDLQWADPDSLDVVESVVEALSGHAVLLVAAARPSMDERALGWQADPQHRWIRLQPLSPDDAGRLTDAALRKVVDCPDSLRTRLIEQAHGNPHNLEETIRMLVDDGVIVVGDDTWTVDERLLSDVRIPPTITGVVQARLDALPSDQRATLQQASVVGRVFWDTVVEELAAVTTEAVAVEPCLSALTRRGMVHHQPASTFADAEEYAFENEVQRSVAYEGILRRVRHTYHSIVADWLIANQDDRRADLGGLIAGHLELAGRTAEALDQFERAAETALAAYAVEAADRFFERALALAPAEATDRRLGLLLGRERTLGMRGLQDEQGAVIDELDTLVGEDHAAAATVDLRRVWWCYFGGRYAEAVEAARSAAAAATLAADLGLQARARSALGVCLFASGDVERARPESEAALALAIEAGDDQAQDSAHTSLGLLLLASSEFSAARDHLAASIDTARRLGDLKRQITGTTNLGVLETRLGNYTAARDAFERTRRIGAEVGDRHVETIGMVNLAWVAASAGDWSTAVDLAEAAVPRSVGQPDAMAESLMWLGHARLGSGDTDGAREAFTKALQLREELGQTALAMGARAGLARSALAAKDLDTALDLVRVITDHLEAGGTLAGAWEPMRIHLTCAQVLRAAGDERAGNVLQRARQQLLSQAERITGTEDRRTFLEAVPWHREILALSDGAAPQSG